jgi:zinc protease
MAAADHVLPTPSKWRLDNGLTVLHLPIDQASLVTTAVSYRAGASSEVDELMGTAHFLEHMMFKGSSGFGPGEIDRRTQLLGGWNNAFTSHDLTVYLFGFASDRWQDALAIEADRMRSLTLDTAEVESERKVIEEEISMYMDDPWDSLELEVQRILFGAHPYARPILGTRDTLERIDSSVLGRFHATHYGPQNALLAVAGDVSREHVEEAVKRHFDDIAPRPADAAEPRERHARATPVRLREALRVERRKGETPRFLLALPAPCATDLDHPHVLAALTVLASGRDSRMHQRLVEELRLCSSVSAEVTESVDAGVSTIAAEALPGVDSALLENEVMEILNRARVEPPTSAEIDRARAVLIADWVYAHERIHQRAVLAATAETLFDADFPARYFRSLRASDRNDFERVAESWLAPADGSVTGWSLPGRRA